MGKRNSINKSPGLISKETMDKANKSPSPKKTTNTKLEKLETPKQTKLLSKIQSEKKQELNKSNKKRKSLAPNINDDSPGSPKKTKIEPFTGTSDLFMEINEGKSTSVAENTPKLKKKDSDKIKSAQNTPKQTTDKTKNVLNTPQQKDNKQEIKKESSDKSTSLGVGLNRAQRRKEKLKKLRSIAKERLNETLSEVATGNEVAIARVKTRISELVQKPTLTYSSKRKLRALRKVLKSYGISDDTSSMKQPTVQQNTSKVGKAKQQIQQTKSENKKSKNASQVNTTNKKLGEQTNKKSEIKQIKLAAKESSDDQSDEAMEEESDVSEGVEAEESEDDTSSENEDDDMLNKDDSEEDEEEEDSDNENTAIENTTVSNEGSDDTEDDDDGEDDDKEDDDDDKEDDDNEIKINNKQDLSKKKSNFPEKSEGDSDFTKNQSRYVVFVGNLPYDITKDEISEHFSKIGKVKDVRIPLDRQTNKCRGFAYVEAANQESYEKALSLHHTSIKGRRINVDYTQGGKKNSDEKKKDIRSKNFKLKAMREQGKFAGSVKQTQKRSFRRGKQRNSKSNE